MATREPSRSERYARLFRKAGVLLGKGDGARALAVLEEGRALAAEVGDTEMERTFAQEIATQRQGPQS